MARHTWARRLIAPTVTMVIPRMRAHLTGTTVRSGFQVVSFSAPDRGTGATMECGPTMVGPDTTVAAAITAVGVSRGAVTGTAGTSEVAMASAAAVISTAELASATVVGTVTGEPEGKADNTGHPAGVACSLEQPQRLFREARENSSRLAPSEVVAIFGLRIQPVRSYGTAPWCLNLARRHRFDHPIQRAQGRPLPIAISWSLTE